MRTIKQLTNYKYLNIKEVTDLKMGNSPFIFAERQGTDSVAFVCYDKDKNQFLLNSEPTPSVGKYLTRAFGGSLDKNITKEEIVIEEVLEEAGYSVQKKNVKYIGRYFVSTQMNQYCHLYIVFISDSQKSKRNPQDKLEMLCKPTWLSKEDILNGDDWKSILVIQKSMDLNLLD